MTSALNNRLVGTVIVVALAVIFLPDFLDRKKEANQEAFVSIPATPAKKPIVNPEPFPTDRVASVTQRPLEVVDEPAVDDIADSSLEPLSESAPASTDNDQGAETVSAKNDAAPEDGSWVVQLGSFRHQKNVGQLLEKLEKAGYRTFSRPIETRSGPLTKVFVGPDVDKNKLQKALPHLQEVTGLKGKVAPFNAE